MGNFQSSVTRNMISSYTTFMNNVISKTYNSSTLDCFANNVMSVTTGRDCYFECSRDCKININQSAVSNCQLDSNNINDIQSTIQNTIKTNTESFINQDLQNKQGFWATAFSLQLANASNVTQVSDIISNSFSSDITNICRSQISAFNNNILDICGIYSDGAELNISQQAISTAIASCVNQNVVRVYQNNETLKELFQKTDAKLSSQQSGINWTALIIIGVIILAIIIVGLILYFLFRGGGSSTKVESISK